MPVIFAILGGKGETLAQLWGEQERIMVGEICSGQRDPREW